MIGIIDTSTSGLVAQRAHLDVIAGNIAMKDVTRDEQGRAIPYRRRVPLLAPGSSSGGPGVRVSAIVEDPSPFGLRYDPGHPDAIKEGKDQGYVRTSNVDYSTEMVNAMTALRAYEANVTVIEMAKSMSATALRLIA